MNRKNRKKITVDVLPPTVQLQNNSEMLRIDNRWINETNQFGMASDPITNTFFGNSQRIGRFQAENLFRRDWAANRIVTAQPEDATREWLTIINEEAGEPNQKILDGLDELDTQAKFFEATVLANLYGGSVIILGAYDGQELFEPLIPEKVTEFGFLLVLDRYQVFPLRWYSDPAHPQFGQPSHYTISPISQQGTSGQTQFIVHESRTVRFDGPFLPVRLRLRNNGWGDSVLETVYEQLRQFGVTTQSAASLMEDFVTKIFKMNDLPEKLNTGQVEKVKERARLAVRTSMNNGMALIGPDDDLTKLSTTVTGIPDLMDRSATNLAAAARMPKSRLFGKQTGLLGGDSNQGEERLWFDQVASYQNIQLTPRVTKIAQLKAIVNRENPEGWSVKWKSLWQLDDKTRAEIHQLEANAHTQWVQNGILFPEEIANGVFGGQEVDFNNISLDQVIREEAEKEDEEEANRQAIEFAERMKLTQGNGNGNGDPKQISE